ncbi:uncharacterized protein K452DRAFT_353205 [Aplosporella prunicola CBS 121167]|uniref:Amine oxidase n=1 Tax=Aplosporella prunicola CBS 121167 TaxID=1176127 RepID=A0A6A6B2G0_9PEZI|nr:uncharacterized protein K452DRAFT_353205 [Aplosporella prunicola CBS 121167]KAF2138369.1 hypothetical protein K452DRAFT_353205 [Aplosporella prunicola CBS 121167]
MHCLSLQQQQQQCRRTRVAILGAGVAGITAAQALSNASITDFLLLEHRPTIGGRVTHAPFGRNPAANGTPYVVELGANWVEGAGPANPIWQLARKWNVSTAYTDYSSVRTYDGGGAADFTDLMAEYEDAYDAAARDAGEVLLEGLHDSSMRTALAMAGWAPAPHDQRRQAVEYWKWDWEAAATPGASSAAFGVAGGNATFNLLGADSHFVVDQRGFRSFVEGEASTFLAANDSRLLLNTTVTEIAYTDADVTVTAADGSCVRAEHALCTFALGVLQQQTASGALRFSPPLPAWKRQAIHAFDMGTYTKLFLQFNTSFWDDETQFHIYASPHSRGDYAVWQSLALPSMLGAASHVLVATLTGAQALRAEAQTDAEAMADALEALRTMFPTKHVPQPTAFMFPRWNAYEWARGSYSNWPVGTTLREHENLRANVGRLGWAGEAGSAQWFGFLQGAWFEGREAGERIVRLLAAEEEVGGKKEADMVRYEVLREGAGRDDLVVGNGYEGTKSRLFS